MRQMPLSSSDFDEKACREWIAGLSTVHEEGSLTAGSGK
jgi:hypothetical protein